MYTAKIEWIGDVAFGVEVLEDGRQMSLDLAEGQHVPEGFHEGHIVEIGIRSEHPAMTAVGVNQGHYMFTHTVTGESFKIMHRNMQWRAE